jgi:hydroxymethylbilane synthase
VESKESIHLRLGTRGSILARLQSQAIADQLMKLRPDVRVELVTIKTTGDKITDRPLHDLGGKGLFTKELELALLKGEVDFAVHSYKDVPVTLPLVDVSQLVVAAVPVREDPRDAIIAGPDIRSIGDLPLGASVATGSLRRKCQLLHRRPDLRIVPIRGNIDTRLQFWLDRRADAVILAAAGLIRSKLFDPALMSRLSIESMVPAAAQGALALQCRADDLATRRVLGLLNDPATKFCTDVERDVISLLNADCHSPIGVHARLIDGQKTEVRLAIGQEGSGRVENKIVVGKTAMIYSDVREALPEP